MCNDSTVQKFANLLLPVRYVRKYFISESRSTLLQLIVTNAFECTGEIALNLREVTINLAIFIAHMDHDHVRISCLCLCIIFVHTNLVCYFSGRVES